MEKILDHKPTELDFTKVKETLENKDYLEDTKIIYFGNQNSKLYHLTDLVSKHLRMTKFYFVKANKKIESLRGI